MLDDMTIDRRFVRDLAFVGADCIGGFILVLFIFQGGLGYNSATLSLVSGAVGGVFPDFLQFVYFKIRREPFTSLQRVHNWIHAKRRLHGFVGIASQLAILAIVVLISKLIMR